MNNFTMAKTKSHQPDKSPATKEDVRQITKEVVIQALMDFWENFVYPELSKKADREEVNARFDDVNQDLDEVKSELKDVKRRVIDLEMDTPTKSEFNRLEKRVSRLEDKAAN